MFSLPFAFTVQNAKNTSNSHNIQNKRLLYTNESQTSYLHSDYLYNIYNQ